LARGTNEVATEANADGKSLLGDIAYSRILETLFEGKIPAGAFLSQKELVQLVDVPMTPVRDALKILEAEGILVVHPRSGIQFVKPGLELTRSTFQFRIILERAAAGAYAEIADEAELDRIEGRHLAAIDRIESKGLGSRVRSEVEDLETLLHSTIVRGLANPLIENTYQRLHNYVRLIRLDRKVTAPLVIRSLREHLKIVRACKARDGEAAAAAMQAHLTAALQRSLGFHEHW
jgi:DNA-binding GntR family transcriptional regulator